MTTIAYRDNLFASDSQATKGSLISYNFRKLFIVPHGKRKFGVAISGDAGLIPRFIHHIQENGIACGPDIQVGQDNVFTALVAVPVSKTKLTLFEFEGTNGVIPIPSETEYFAIGEGSGIALGSMYTGGDPLVAVAAAIEYCAGTGGDIQTLVYNKGQWEYEGPTIDMKGVYCK